MISVLTLTYQRKNLLEEAIFSYLQQDYKQESEMVVVNDSPDVEYEYDHPRIRIINSKERFGSIGNKLRYSYQKCKGDYIFRLDDDDLMMSFALSNAMETIGKNPDYELYRPVYNYLFFNNEFEKINSGTNTGNVYGKKYLDRIDIPDKMVGEDIDITFGNNVKSFKMEKIHLIYRWFKRENKNHYHASRENNQEEIDKRLVFEKGKILLNPHFDKDYQNSLLINSEDSPQ